jgi:hypothetical protein
LGYLPIQMNLFPYRQIFINMLQVRFKMISLSDFWPAPALAQKHLLLC